VTRRALYPGRFDPVTNGHLNLIRRAADLFDELVVGVAISSPIFSVEERVDFICKGIGDLPSVSVQRYGGLTTDFAREVGASVLVCVSYDQPGTPLCKREPDSRGREPRVRCIRAGSPPRG
jgi:pantetheine-phosphate adenylyltransferase